jgi:hypothetical protein
VSYAPGDRLRRVANVVAALVLTGIAFRLLYVKLSWSLYTLLHILGGVLLFVLAFEVVATDSELQDAKCYIKLLEITSVPPSERRYSLDTEIQ